MGRPVKELTFREKINAFLNHLEIARLEEGRIGDGLFQPAVDDFCSRVSHAVKARAEGGPMGETTVCGKMKIDLPKDELWSADNTIFRVVELVECRLFGANSLFGISLNAITSHFRHEYDESNNFTFSWTIKISDIKDPATYPTVESALRSIRRENREE